MKKRLEMVVRFVADSVSSNVHSVCTILHVHVHTVEQICKRKRRGLGYDAWTTSSDLILYVGTLRLATIISAPVSR